MSFAIKYDACILQWILWLPPLLLVTTPCLFGIHMISWCVKADLTYGYHL